MQDWWDGQNEDAKAAWCQVGAGSLQIGPAMQTSVMRASAAGEPWIEQAEGGAEWVMTQAFMAFVERQC